jgi:hypothetical protein
LVFELYNFAKIIKKGKGGITPSFSTELFIISVV